MPELKDINGVEIFATGEWNGQKFGETDIDQIVSSFEQIGSSMKPYLKLGHDSKQNLIQNEGLPSMGWVKNLKRIGGKLVADFRAVPQKIYDLITKGAYRRVSSEMYVDYKLGEATYPKVLKAVALLGGDTPAVKTLDDILALGFNDANEVTFVKENEIEYECIQINHTEVDEMSDAIKVLQEKHEQEVKKFEEQAKTLGEQVKEFTEAIEGKDAEIKQLKETGEKQFTELEKIRTEKEEGELEAQVEKFAEEKKILPAQKEKVKNMLKNAKTDEEKKDIQEFLDAQTISLNTDSQSNTGKPGSDNTGGDDPDGSKLDTRVKKYMEEHKGITYGVAYRKVASGLDK